MINTIKALMTRVPRGGPIGTQELAAIGVSSALAYQYVKSGWLERLGRGVFMFAGDTLQLDPSIRFLAQRHPGLHVGGKTALGWRGIRHHLPAREQIVLWSTKQVVLPVWFVERFPANITARRLFSKSVTNDFAMEPLPGREAPPPVSAPERALLEMLSEVGLDQEIEEARHLMESVRTLRAEVLTRLLRACRQVKTVRLCVLWSEELSLPWAQAARQAVSVKKHRHRWLTRTREGKTLVLKPL